MKTSLTPVLIGAMYTVRIGILLPLVLAPFTLSFRPDIFLLFNSFNFISNVTRKSIAKKVKHHFKNENECYGVGNDK